MEYLQEQIEELQLQIQQLHINYEEQNNDHMEIEAKT